MQFYATLGMRTIKKMSDLKELLFSDIADLILF